MTSATEPTAEEISLLEDVIGEILSSRCTPEARVEGGGDPDTALWETLRDSGFTRFGVAAEAGGDGGGLVEAATLVRWQHADSSAARSQPFRRSSITSSSSR